MLDPEWSHTQSRDSYHLNLGVDDYFPNSLGHRYHSEFLGSSFDIPNPISTMTFEIFSSLPLQHSTPPDTPPRSSEENVDHHKHSQHERRPP
ncbi:hypothetical protein J1N35_005645 [Gossypium stocksii]|uniref:Uncharacterized protein n=1 Tax=Gossypium stocksii TaxID=47602 RepID=A0A9D3WFP8_9ROSI|nr:hypothetical protein J1N35_005645 [Gossypium stocksii]